MRALALVIALLRVPAFAADYTSWLGQELEPVASQQIAPKVLSGQKIDLTGSDFAVKLVKELWN